MISVQHRILSRFVKEDQMPVDCRIDGQTMPMPNRRQCEAAGGTVIAPPDKDKKHDCFVRNVFTRTLGGTVLDIGWAGAVGQGIVDALEIPSRRRRRAGSRPSIVQLTPAKRRALTARAASAILTLARTYPTTHDFRDRLLLTTPRGRQWNRYYDRYLPEIFHVADRDLELMNASATAWLALYPFVRAMVRAASAKRPSAGGKVTFTRRQHKACVNLIQRFRKGSKDRSFRAVLGELQRELAGYVGLSAEQAVAKLRKSRSKHA
jgi:hypothetical protein